MQCPVCSHHGAVIGIMRDFFVGYHTSVSRKDQIHQHERLGEKVERLRHHITVLISWAAGASRSLQQGTSEMACTWETFKLPSNCLRNTLLACEGSSATQTVLSTAMWRCLSCAAHAPGTCCILVEDQACFLTCSSIVGKPS